MTVDELIEALKKISDNGGGSRNVEIYSPECDGYICYGLLLNSTSDFCIEKDSKNNFVFWPRDLISEL